MAIILPMQMPNLDKTGLLREIIAAVYNIAKGRKGFATKGLEREGRISYEYGITLAQTTFAEAEKFADCETICLAEHSFLTQELQFCAENDVDVRNSLNAAIQSFDDALRCLKAVDEPGYIITDKTYPTDPKYRVQNLPKDAVHIACIAHITRLRNVLRSPGIDMIEKNLLQQRLAALKAAQRAYTEKQKRAFF